MHGVSFPHAQQGIRLQGVRPFTEGALQCTSVLPRCVPIAERRAATLRTVRPVLVSAVSEEEPFKEETFLTKTPEPEDARGAIAVGLKLYNAGKHQEALDVFVKALELPGTGIKRFRDKPKLISAGEKQAALFNIACCYSRLEQAREGLAALAGCLEAGYEDAGQLRSDPDLEFLRQDERFEGLLQRFRLGQSGGEGFFNSLLKGFGR